MTATAGSAHMRRMENLDPSIVVLAVAILWLAGIILAWAFVHGAQKLRRQQTSASEIAAQPPYGPSPVTPSSRALWPPRIIAGEPLRAAASRIPHTWMIP